MVKAHILIVEDEILVARELETRVRQMGYFVDGIAASAAEALELLEDRAPDLALMDIVLKGPVDGITLAAKIRKTRDIPSIFVTSFCDETTLELAKTCEPYGYLIKPFSEHELRATLAMALHKRQTDLKLRNAYEELRAMSRDLRIKNEELADQLRIAHQMQLSMLPSKLPPIPSGAAPNQSALTLESFYTPCGLISGDFFTFTQVSENSVGVFLCDVMGHNVSAALVTAMIRALVEEFGSGPEAGQAGQLLTRINSVLARMFEQSQAMIFATAVYVLVDIANAEIRFANAAHPCPLYLSRAEARATPMRDPNASCQPALGLFAETVYRTHRRAMAPGDSILLYTDGIFEVEGADQQQFSHKRLLEAVNKRVQMPARRIFSEVLGEVETFAEGRRFPDDICLLALDIHRCGHAFGQSQGHLQEKPR